MEFDEVSGKVIGCAIEVHRTLGPGLLESVYRRCLEHELTVSGLRFESEKAVEVWYKGNKLDCPNLRVDLIVGGVLLVELKVVERLLPVHEAQLLTYMKLTQCRIGLLINFDCQSIKNGLKRLVL
ncbi:MAG TPA: GxxExxY protein [Rudaea sp.]|nr:GxxExxY protein [Rudaea sp.]HSC09974.1 GxxExxY protein [Rhodanobacteraceae bacterium]